MTRAFGHRTLAAILVAAVAAAAVLLIASDLPSALIALVGGIAAALLAAGADDDQPAEGTQSADVAAAAPETGDVIDAIVAPVLIVHAGRVTHANPAARTLLGGHIVGEDVRLAIRHPAAAERLAGPIDPSQGPTDLVGLGTLDQRWQMHVGAGAGGQRIVHLIDQTGNYAAERMRVDFVANASHELRTPLASILGYIETLEEENAGADRAVRSRFLKIMFDESRRMQRLVEDLISLSRIEAEKYRLPDTAVELDDLIAEVRTELLDLVESRGGEIVTDLAEDVPPVAGDRAQLSQMLHNLIGNAIKYGRSGAPVTVRLWRDQTGMVRISVTDEGDGISPEHLPRLTERFYRVDPGRSRAAGGTGLGLAIVKHIVERHRGRLDITSVIRKGTTVTVLLPAHGAAVIKR